MHTRRHLFTSESVSEGHPDKIADQISDAILDAFLAEEPEAKVACETFVADNLVVIAGEFKTVRKELFDEVRERAEGIARQVLRDIGYRDTETGIDPNTCEVQVRFNHQSIQIHKGITLAGGDIGAGDQGLIRLCLRRDARPDALSGLVGASPGAETGRTAQVRRLALAASRCQKPGDGGL